MQAALQAIRAKLESEWQHPEVPVFWPNEPNEIPDDAPFLFITIEPWDEVFAGFGGGRGRNEMVDKGFIRAVVFIPRHTPIDTAVGLADDFSAIFRGQRFSGVSCFAAKQVGGDSSADNGNYWEYTVMVDFQYRFKG